MKPNGNRLTLVKIFMTEQCGHDADLEKDYVSCLSITNMHAPVPSGTAGAVRYRAWLGVDYFAVKMTSELVKNCQTQEELASRSVSAFTTFSKETTPFSEPLVPRSKSIQPSLKPSSIRMRGIGFFIPCAVNN